MNRSTFKRRSGKAGYVSVEFAIVAIIFFTIVFATLELARVEYLFNTLQEVTRRAAAAAANVDYRDPVALAKVRDNAVFRDSSGALMLGTPVTSQHVKIDYLSVSAGTWALNHMTSLPGCPAGNRSNCMTDPNADNCIRFVRARVCASMDGNGACERLPYEMVFPFLNLSGTRLPSAETIVPVGSLGVALGAMPCT